MSLLTPLLTYYPITLLTLLLLHLYKTYTTSSLQRFPPAHPLAALTNWWRYLDVRSRHAEQTHIAAHRRHGDIVRLGPNVLSFAEPRALKQIYGLNKGVTKSAFYSLQNAVADGRPLQSLFSTRDEEYHAKYRRCVNAAFSMSSLVGYEPLVEKTMDVFIRETERRFVDGEDGRGRVCDFAQWLQFFAFDVIGELTWSRRLGFVERGEDVEGIVGFVSKFLSYVAPAGQVPWIDSVWNRNPLWLKLQQWGWNKTVFPVTKFALDRAAERSGEMDKIRREGIVQENAKRGVDLLSKFTLAQHDHPEFMTDRQVLSSCTSMIFAGSETTAISLSSIFYHLLKNPAAYKKLMEELDEAAANGTIEERTNKKVSWAESAKLSYLDAVIQESLRLHPAPGLILERVVPALGMTICDEFIPGGTIVGCNPWVVHRRPEVYGSDVESFRPERWLDATPEQLKEMKATMFVFGGGSRTCIGKNISLLEMYKLVPTFLRNFEVELANPEGEWETYNAWFVRVRQFATRFRRRDAPAGVYEVSKPIDVR